ncbi:hypothetical protein Bca52824_021911 [Brassica carinata]|uniref:Uncharacterized protein n=1 Tax=Brassica carinata TaxID=52824 RepID=A0A8X7VFP8_BRACI|nr:hypothetical protein Bca52824_021911 [Brassica carinata]
MKLGCVQYLPPDVQIGDLLMGWHSIAVGAWGGASACVLADGYTNLSLTLVFGRLVCILDVQIGDLLMGWHSIAVGAWGGASACVLADGYTNLSLTLVFGRLVCILGGFEDLKLLERLVEGKEATGVIGYVAKELGTELLVMRKEDMDSELISCHVILLPMVGKR